MHIDDSFFLDFPSVEKNCSIRVIYLTKPSSLRELFFKEYGEEYEEEYFPKNMENILFVSLPH